MMIRNAKTRVLVKLEFRRTCNKLFVSKVVPNALE